MAKSYFSDVTNQEYTKSDFLLALIRRIKKDLRNNTPLDMKKQYCLYDQGLLTQISIRVLEKIFENRLTVIILDQGEDLFDDLVLLNDDYLEKYLSTRVEVFFKMKPTQKLSDNSIPILRAISYSELIQLQEIFQISGKIEKQTNDFVENLQKEYSQTKTSFLKSFNHIDKLLK